MGRLKNKRGGNRADLFCWWTFWFKKWKYNSWISTRMAERLSFRLHETSCSSVANYLRALIWPSWGNSWFGQLS